MFRQRVTFHGSVPEVYKLRKLLICSAFLFLPAVAAAQTATVLANAPIYVTPVATQSPLRVASAGTTLQVLEDQGEWAKIAYNDPQWGRRIGWVQRSTIRIKDEALQPMDLSVPERPAPASPAVQPVFRPAETSYAYPTTETSIGWAFLNVEDINSTLGWNASFAGNLAPWIGIVGDVTGNYKTSLLAVDDLDAMMHTFVGGPRFSLRTFPLTTPFAEFLVGMTHLHESFAELDANEFAFTIQPGGGIDIGNDRTAARFSFAWRRGFFEGETVNMFRFVAGVVVRR
jgi:hypothetical protein